MPERRRVKARIIDIALQAGVSTATVDRVLNRRPGVRQKTIDRVQEAVQLLDRAAARPSVIPTIAIDLTIDAVIAGGAGFANDILAAELRRATQAAGVRLRLDLPQRMNPHALATSLDRCLKNGASAVIVQPLDHPLVREKIAQLGAARVPVVFILTDLPGIDALGYVGLDNRAAGRAAGLLMGRLCRGTGRVAIFWGGPFYRSHEEREMGFRTIIRDEFPGITLLDAVEGRDDPARIFAEAQRVLQAHPDLAGILNIGGGNRGIEKALRESGRAAETVYIAYNLTPLTRNALMTGLMDAVIQQEMGRAADMAVAALVNHAVRRPVKIERLPVQIVMRENLP